MNTRYKKFKRVILHKPVLTRVLAIFSVLLIALGGGVALYHYHTVDTTKQDSQNSTGKTSNTQAANSSTLCVAGSVGCSTQQSTAPTPTTTTPSPAQSSTTPAPSTATITTPSTSTSSAGTLAECNTVATDEQTYAASVYNEGISVRNTDISVVQGYISELPTLIDTYNADPTPGNQQNVNSNIAATQNAISNYNVNLKGFNDHILQDFDTYEGDVSQQCPTLTIAPVYQLVPYLPAYTADSPWNP